VEQLYFQNVRKMCSFIKKIHMKNSISTIGAFLIVGIFALPVIVIAAPICYGYQLLTGYTPNENPKYTAHCKDCGEFHHRQVTHCSKCNSFKIYLTPVSC